jgi:hypothetical protein
MRGMLSGGATVPPTDPYFANVVLLSHFDGTPGTISAGSVIDESPYAHVPADVTGTMFDATNPRFGPTAAEFSGSARIIWNATGSEFAFGTGDFTVEIWTRPTSIPGSAILDMRPAFTNGAHLEIGTSSSGEIGVFVNNAVQIISATGVWLANTYQIITCCRVSGTTRLFVDGVQVGSDWADSNNYTSTRVVLAQTSFSTDELIGNLDDVRITNGVGRYATNFAPPSAPFPNSGPTSDPYWSDVLASIPCDVDTSGVALDIGPNATTGRGISIQTANAISGGYLVFGATARPITLFPIHLPNEFTWEFTLNMPDVTTIQALCDCRPNNVDPGGMIFTVTSGSFQFYNNSTSLILNPGGSLFTANTDAHVCIQRKDIAGTLTLQGFVDGTLVASGTDTSNYTAQPPMFFFETSFSTAPCATGSKIRDWRITTNVARYTDPYTPVTPFPTS